jgi:hypothetical protein
MIIMIAMAPTELKIYNRYIDEQIPKMFEGNNTTRKNECSL